MKRTSWSKSWPVTSSDHSPQSLIFFPSPMAKSNTSFHRWQKGSAHSLLVQLLTMTSCRIIASTRNYISRGGSRKLFLQYVRYTSTDSTSSSNNTTPDNNIQQNRLARARQMDPTAKRPNKICDPYGQKGKSMTLESAEMMKRTMNVEDDWQIIVMDESKDRPTSLVREFTHANFLDGADFVRKMAAVALVNHHYPSIELDRRVMKKNWQVVSRITCRTKVLEGLSSFDFHLAMVSTQNCSSY